MKHQPVQWLPICFRYNQTSTEEFGKINLRRVVWSFRSRWRSTWKGLWWASGHWTRVGRKGKGEKDCFAPSEKEHHTSLDFNYVKPFFDLLQFSYNFITLGQKDFLI